MKKTIFTAITGIFLSMSTLYGQYAVVDAGTHGLLTSMQTMVTANQQKEYVTMLDQLTKLGEQYTTMKEQLSELKQIYDTGTKIYDEGKKVREYMGDPSKLAWYIADNYINMNTYNKLKGIYENSVDEEDNENQEISDNVKNIYGDFKYNEFKDIGGIDGDGGFKALQKQIQLRDNTIKAGKELLENNGKLLQQVEELKNKMKSATTDADRQYILGCIQLLLTNYQITKDNYVLQKDTEAGNSMAQEATEKSVKKAREKIDYEDAMENFKKTEPLDVEKISKKYMLEKQE